MKCILAAVPYMNTRIPPLSIALLSGELKKHGFQVKSFDFNIDAYSRAGSELKTYWKMQQGYQWSDEELFSSILYPKIVAPSLGRWCRKILNEKPDIVGISVTASKVGNLLAQEIRKWSPTTKIIFGGPSCSKSYEGHALTPDETYMDAVVDGEGEETLVALLKDYEIYGEFKPVLGAEVFYEGKWVFKGVRPPISDLDTLAYPDYSDFDFNQYDDIDSYGLKKDLRELPVYSQRGCIAKCRFCVDYKMWAQYRFKSAKAFVNELEFLKFKYKTEDFFFVELLLNGSHRWLREFSMESQKRGLFFKFHSHGRISKGMSPQLLSELKKVGLFHLNYGLESGSDCVLKLMQKGYNKAIASQCIKDTYDQGITMTLNLVIGFPGETWEDCLETLDFIYEHRKYIWSKPNLSMCDAIPGSDIYLYPEKFGIKINYQDANFYENWETLDGENTLAVRKNRKKMLNTYFSQFSFQENKDKEEEIPRDEFYQKSREELLRLGSRK